MVLKKLYEILEILWASCFQIIFGPLSLLPKSFATMIFLQLVVQEKEDMKQNREINIVKIVDNVVENLTQGR